MAAVLVLFVRISPRAMPGASGIARGVEYAVDLGAQMPLEGIQFGPERTRGFRKDEHDISAASSRRDLLFSSALFMGSRRFGCTGYRALVMCRL